MFKKVTYRTGEDARINTVEPIRDKYDLHRIMRFFYDQGWDKYAVIFWFGINTGLRISDILGFKVKDIRGKHRYAIREQKTGKVKFIPVKDELYTMLNDYIKDKQDDEWVFTGRKDRKLDRTQVYRRINEAIEALDIDANVGTHTLRKTFGYHAYRQFKNVVSLQEIFNHATQDVTKRYIGITQDEIDTIYLNLNLSVNANDLRSNAKPGNSRYRVARVKSFCTNYLKNHGETHAEFARIVLELLDAPEK